MHACGAPDYLSERFRRAADPDWFDSADTIQR